jgi:hypothetical protein
VLLTLVLGACRKHPWGQALSHEKYAVRGICPTQHDIRSDAGRPTGMVACPNCRVEMPRISLRASEAEKSLREAIYHCPRRGAETKRWECYRSAYARRPAHGRALFIADILFGPPAPFAPEGDEVWLGLPDFVPGHHHDGAAVQARRILAGVQRIEQEFLVARHSVLFSRT